MRQPLAREHRSQLERTVIKARDIAEQAVREELHRLGIGERKAADYLTEEQRSLRNRLRVHGRQIGDRRKPTGEQSIEHLVTETAYEHWHRMLFARFLAENNLLMYEDGVTALAIQDCFDLAEEETGDSSNGWQYAAGYAAKMLPQIFRIDSPVFEISLPPNHQQQLEQLLASLAEATFQAQDSLGWVYQFWQSKKKEAVNKSEVKIGADELPAVTQLFTEPYMVSFLLDNSLGAWWVSNHADKPRPVPLEYLRTLEDGTPAAGSFEAWPKNLSELKVLDPSCGSGHFLVEALLMLVPMRLAVENLTAREAVDAVLSDNIHGLELDQRCVELAAFALALTAWSYPDAGGYRLLPELHIACSGLSVSVGKEEWKKLALDKHNLRIALDWMHESFKQAPVLGSLINPAKTNAASIVEWDELSATLEQALAQDQSDEQHEVGVVAQGLAKSASLLARKYHWVITNVPYLKRGKHNQILRDFCEINYPSAKNDLATVFLDRCLEFCEEGGTTSVVLPQNWLFLTSYKNFREKLLIQDTWQMIARLGAGAFETISGEVVKAILLIMSRGNHAGSGIFENKLVENWIHGLDVSESRSVAEKAVDLMSSELKSVEQGKQLDNPDFTIEIDQNLNINRVGDFFVSVHGLTSGDNFRLTRKFWELFLPLQNWNWYQTSTSDKDFFCGLDSMLNWNGLDDLKAFIPGFRPDGRSAWGKKGISIARVGSLNHLQYSGTYYSHLLPVLIPKFENVLIPFLSFCETGAFREKVRETNQALSVDGGYLEKVSFDLDHWIPIAAEKYPNGLPKPYSDDPTQWIFHGHPCGSVVWDEVTKWTAQGSLRYDSNVLQVAVARLLGYQWPAETDTDMDLSDEAHHWIEKTKTLSSHVDDDGIVCLSAVRGERPAYERLEALLQTAYGDEWSTHVRNKLLENIGFKNKTLELWLREKFFEQHIKLFQNRPFIWHIWDGLTDGFSVLVNYHKLDKKNLERLIYTYLDDWIRTQSLQQADNIDGAAERLVAAENLKQRLELILEGEAPYDIFIRWKPLDKQPIGWNPDINDGVRLNIRPFMTIADVGKKGAGILRAKPNIHWKKDRGKDVESAPWYKLGLEYDGKEGDRINDHHLTLAEKLVSIDKHSENR